MGPRTPAPAPLGVPARRAKGPREARRKPAWLALFATLDGLIPYMLLQVEDIEIKVLLRAFVILTVLRSVRGVNVKTNWRTERLA